MIIVKEHVSKFDKRAGLQIGAGGEIANREGADSTIDSDQHPSLTLS